MAPCLPADRNRGPYGLLISGITADGAELLLNLGTFITAGAIFFFQPLDTPNSKYIGTLEGLTVPEGRKGSEIVRDIFMNCLRVNNDALNHIRNGAPDSPDDEANKVVASISAEPLAIKTREGPTKTVWNLYCTPPPIPHHAYQEWIEIVRNLCPSDYDAGRGYFRNERPFLCAGCRSINHPTGLCPLPLTMGWLGPAANSELPEDATALDTAPATTTRGQARTGRGRGGPTNHHTRARTGRGNSRRT